ncbi:uncharacterized protein A4U43_C08F14600 [Asparagus officinalis]|nr:uncharacterized protein A4U43_C08F14600 [Asparagus officinalis]
MLGHRGRGARLVELTKKEKRTIADKEEEFRPFTQARPSIVVPAARRKRLAHKPRADPRASEMDLAGDDPASDGGERGEGEMSLDPAPRDFIFSDELDLPHQVEKPAEAVDVRETINVEPDSANTSTIDNIPFRWQTKELNDSEFVPPLIVSMLLALLDKLQGANMDLGSREANTPVGDFLTDDFDEGGLLVDTPMLHFIYGSPQTDDQLPESTLPKNPEDGPFEEAFVETDPVEPAVRPTTSADTSTAATPPLPPVTQGEEGFSSRLHVLAKELLSDNDPEKIDLFCSKACWFCTLSRPLFAGISSTAYPLVVFIFSYFASASLSGPHGDASSLNNWIAGHAAYSNNTKKSTAEVYQ